MSDCGEGELARCLLEAAPEPIVASDSAGVILFASASVERLFGHAPAALIGQPVEMLLASHCHRIHAVRYQRLCRSGTSGATEQLQLLGLHREGREFPVQITLGAARATETTIVLALIRDDTEHRELARRLALARRARRRLTRIDSHALRQPLQALGLLTAAAARQAGNDPVLSSIICRQRQALNSLYRLLDDAPDPKRRGVGGP